MFTKHSSISCNICDVGRYSCNFKEFKDFPWFFRNKIDDHHNIKLKIFNNDPLFIYPDYSYLTFNTTAHNLNKVEYIGQTFTKKGEVAQYLNYDYILSTTKYTDKFLTKSGKLKDFKLTETLWDILNNSGKKKIIEDNVSNIYMNYENCLKHTHNFADCYQMLTLKHLEIGNIISELIIYKIS